MKYIAMCTALSAVLLSGCSSVQRTADTRDRNADPLRSVKTLLVTTPPKPAARQTPAAILSSASPATALHFPSNTAIDTGLPAALTDILSQKQMIETAGINDAFAPLYKQYGMHSGIIEAHGALFMERRRYADVIQLVKGARTQGASLTSGIFNMAGMAGFAQKDYSTAMHFFNAARDLQPNDTKTANNIAVLHLAQRRPTEALQALSAVPVRMVADRVRAGHVAYNKAMAYAMLGNFAESEHLLRMTMQQPDVQASLNHFRSLLQQPSSATFSIDRVAGLTAGRYNAPGTIAPISAPVFTAQTQSNTSFQAALPVTDSSVREVFEQTASYETPASLQRVAYIAADQSAEHTGYRVVPQPYVPPIEKDPSHIFSPDTFYDSDTENEQIAVRAAPLPAYQDPLPVYVQPDAAPARERPLPDRDVSDTASQPAISHDTAYIPEENAGFILPNPMPDTPSARRDTAPITTTYAGFQGFGIYGDSDFRTDKGFDMPLSSQGSVAGPGRPKQPAAPQHNDTIFDDGQLAAFAEEVASPQTSVTTTDNHTASSLPYKQAEAPAYMQPADSDKRYYIVEESAADERDISMY